MRPVIPLPEVERLVLLSSMSLLKGLKREQLEAFASLVRSCEFRAGEVVFAADGPVDAVHFVVDGEIEVKNAHGSLFTYRKHDSVGWLGIHARVDAGLVATAVKASKTLVLDGDALGDLYEHPLHGFPVMFHFLREFSRLLMVRMQSARGLGRRGSIEYTYPDVGDRTLHLVERMVFLRKLQLFRSIDVDTLAEIAKSLQEARFQAGDLLWEEGATARRVLYVLKGIVETTSRSGLVVDYEAPAVLGSIALIAEAPYWNSGRAKTDLIVLVGDDEVMPDVIEDNTEIAMAMLAMFARGLIEEQDGGRT